MEVVLRLEETIPQGPHRASQARRMTVTAVGVRPEYIGRTSSKPVNNAARPTALPTVSESVETLARHSYSDPSPEKEEASGIRQESQSQLSHTRARDFA